MDRHLQIWLLEYLPFAPYGQYWTSDGGIIDDFIELLAVSDSVVEIVNNHTLQVDTAAYRMNMKDPAIWQFILSKKVSQLSWVFSPYNRFPDTLIYYPPGDSMRLFSGIVSDSESAIFITMKTP
jgi:hypothetical protein